MKRTIFTLFALTFTIIQLFAQDLALTNVYVQKDAELKQLIFTIEVEGLAGNTIPTPNGALDGAPVYGYVFPTTLNPLDVGFDDTEGIVALALTSHPDFDDTPLWDEDNDANYANDGYYWHPHWVLLVDDERVFGGLSVKATTKNSVLPPTNPGMPMYMDSPGYPVMWSGNKISCIVPLSRINNKDDFNYDGVTSLLKVNTSDDNLPMLGVYSVYSIASGNLSLPYSVGSYSSDTLYIDVSPSTDVGIVEPGKVSIYPNPASTDVHIDITSEINTGKFRISIYNLNGSLVYQSEALTGNISIPVSEIGSNGTYILKVIETESGIVKGTKKINLF